MNIGRRHFAVLCFITATAVAYVGLDSHTSTVNQARFHNELVDQTPYGMPRPPRQPEGIPPTSVFAYGVAAILALVGTRLMSWKTRSQGEYRNGTST